MSNKSELDELREIVKHQSAEIEKLKPPVQPTEKEIAAAKDVAHQMRERQMASASYFSPDQLAAMKEAGRDAQAIVHDHRNAPQGPTSIIPSSSGTSVRGSIGRGTVSGGSGWAHQTPLRNGLGQGK